MDSGAGDERVARPGGVEARRRDRAQVRGDGGGERLVVGGKAAAEGDDDAVELDGPERQRVAFAQAVRVERAPRQAAFAVRPGRARLGAGEGGVVGVPAGAGAEALLRE